MATQDEVDAQQKLLQAQTDSASALRTIEEVAGRINDLTLSRATTEKIIFAETAKIKEKIEESLKTEEKFKQLSEDQKNSILKTWETERKISDELKNRLAPLKEIIAAKERAVAPLKEEAELLKKQGGLLDNLKAKQLELNALRKEKGAGHTVGTVAAGAVGLAQDPSKIYDVMGPWGQVLKVIVSIIDGVRNMAGGFLNASAAAGQFGKAADASFSLAEDVQSHSADTLLKFGMDAEHVGKNLTALMNTGLFKASELQKNFANVAMTMEVFSKATGQSLEQVAGQIAELKRNFTLTKDAGEEYTDMIGDAQKVAEAGIMTVGEYMQKITGLGKAFAGAGFEASKTSKFLADMSLNFKKMGASAELINQMTTSIVQANNASQEWKAMFGAIGGGATGGFMGALKRFEQRGPGMSLIGRHVDASQQAGDMARTFAILTRGQNTEMATLMSQQMAQQANMTPEAGEALMKLAKGGFKTDSPETKASWKSLVEETKSSNIWSKDLMELLKQILLGVLGKIIIGIWKAVQSLLELFGGMSEAQRNERAGGKMSMFEKLTDDVKMPGGETQSNGQFSGPASLDRGFAMGGTIQQTGYTMVHQGEEVLNRNEATSYRNGGRASGGGMNLSVNVNIQGDLKKAFDDAYQRTLKIVTTSQRAAYGV